MKKFTKQIVFIFTFIIIIILNKETFATQYKNTTKAYFLSEVTAGYGCGDCILLENYDSNGDVHYGLIDAGREIKTRNENGEESTKIKEFLKQHMKTNELEFLLITHSHGDHNGDAVTVINNFNVKALYMKEYDNLYSESNGWQWKYEEIIKACVNNNVNIIGCNYEAIISKAINPSTSKSFLEFLKQNSNKSNLFKGFNERNTKFIFGSSNIEILNWEFHNKDGSIWNYGDSISNREIVTNENNNSLGVLLIQGNKKAFFAGDINNYDKDESINKIGDEDCIKNKIGDIELLKLGHHGYSGSNTEEYLSTLKPEYAVITNDIACANKKTIDWLENNNVEYLYSTEDKKSVIATITNDEVNLNFETTEEFKKINKKLYYISKNTNKETDWKNLIYKIEYYEVQKNVSTWEELEATIIENKNNYIVDVKNKKIIVKKLNIFIEKNLIANKKIEIDTNQFISILPTKNDIIIKRDYLYKKEFFNVKGELSLGEQDMNYKIILDGNKENVISESPIIEVDNGIINIYENIFIINNNHTVMKDNSVIRKYDTTISYSASGSGIKLNNESIFNMYGGEISGNIVENKKELNLENIDINNYYNASCEGAGIYIARQSTFNMYGGKIIQNQAYNNSKIIIKNSKNKGTVQNIAGVGIYVQNSFINIENGEIYNNYAENNSKIIISSSEICISENSVYGIGSYINNSNVNIKNTKENNNTGKNNTCIELYNSQINKYSNCKIDAGAIFLNISNTIIENNEISKNKIINDSNISLDNSTIQSLETTPHGGAICSSNENIQINELKMENNVAINNSKITISNNSIVNNANNSARGGTIYFNNMKANIENSEICNGIVENNIIVNKNEDSNIYYDNNSYGGAIYGYKITLNIKSSNITSSYSGYGGAIYISDNNSIAKIVDTEISNNNAKSGSGGGIYAYGKIFINGENTKINGNTAKTYGGGIMIKNIAVIEDAEILENKAELYAGGGIRVDGRLIIISGKVKGNISETTGGGIDYSNGVLIKNNAEIIDNTANNPGTENLYPHVAKITKDEIPPDIKVNYNKNESQEIVEVTIVVKDSLSEVKKVTINGKNLEVTNDGVITLHIDRNGIFIVKAKDYIGNTATKEFVISSLTEENTEKLNNITQTTEEKTDVQEDNTTELTKESSNSEENIVRTIKNINKTVNLKENTMPDSNEANEETTASEDTEEKNINEQEANKNTEEKNTNEQEVNKDIEEKDTNEQIETKEIIDKENTKTNADTYDINDSKEGAQNEVTAEDEYIIIENEYGEIMDSDYIDDEQTYKEIQEALASNVPNTGQKSLTLIFVILGIIAFENYIKLRKYREII